MLGGWRTTAALLASLLLASPARAEPGGPTQKDRQLAGDLVKKAIAKSDAGDHGAAIKIYLQAYTIVPDSNLLSNIGTEFQEDGKLAEALRYFCMYLKQDPNGTNVPYAISQAKALQIELGNKDVDERDVCEPPRPERREPRRKDPPRFDPPATPPEAIDTQDPDPAPPGRTDKTLRNVGIVSGLAGLAAVGVGAYTGVRARAISDEISSHDRTQPWPNGIRDTERRGQLFENIQIGSFIAGGVLVTTGAILYVASRPSSPELSSSKAVRLAPTTNGFVVFGHF